MWLWSLLERCNSSALKQSRCMFIGALTCLGKRHANWLKWQEQIMQRLVLCAPLRAQGNYISDMTTIMWEPWSLLIDVIFKTWNLCSKEAHTSPIFAQGREGQNNVNHFSEVGLEPRARKGNQVSWNPAQYKPAFCELVSFSHFVSCSGELPLAQGGELPLARSHTVILKFSGGCLPGNALYPDICSEQSHKAISVLRNFSEPSKRRHTLKWYTTCHFFVSYSPIYQALKGKELVLLVSNPLSHILHAVTNDNVLNPDYN